MWTLCWLPLATFFLLVVGGAQHLPKELPINEAVIGLDQPSMSPHIERGSVVFTVKPGMFGTSPVLHRGDVVSFRATWAVLGITGVVTHRIVDLWPDGTIVTKGDANLRQDYEFKPVHASDVLGRREYVIPKLGILVTHPVPVIFIGLVLCLWAFSPLWAPWMLGRDDEAEASTTIESRTPVRV